MWVTAALLLLSMAAARAQSIPAWQSNHPYASGDFAIYKGVTYLGAAADDLDPDPYAGGHAWPLAGGQSEGGRPMCRGPARAHRIDLFQSDQHRRDPRLESTHAAQELHPGQLHDPEEWRGHRNDEQQSLCPYTVALDEL